MDGKISPSLLGSSSFVLSENSADKAGASSSSGSANTSLFPAALVQIEKGGDFTKQLKKHSSEWSSIKSRLTQLFFDARLKELSLVLSAVANDDRLLEKEILEKLLVLIKDDNFRKTIKALHKAKTFLVKQIALKSRSRIPILKKSMGACYSLITTAPCQIDITKCGSSKIPILGRSYPECKSYSAGAFSKTSEKSVSKSSVLPIRVGEEIPAKPVVLSSKTKLTTSPPKTAAKLPAKPLVRLGAKPAAKPVSVSARSAVKPVNKTSTLSAKSAARTVSKSVTPLVSTRVKSMSEKVASVATTMSKFEIKSTTVSQVVPCTINVGHAKKLLRRLKTLLGCTLAGYSLGDLSKSEMEIEPEVGKSAKLELEILLSLVKILRHDWLYLIGGSAHTEDVSHSNLSQTMVESSSSEAFLMKSLRHLSLEVEFLQPLSQEELIKKFEILFLADGQLRKMIGILIKITESCARSSSIAEGATKLLTLSLFGQKLLSWCDVSAPDFSSMESVELDLGLMQLCTLSSGLDTFKHDCGIKLSGLYK